MFKEYLNKNHGYVGDESGVFGLDASKNREDKVLLRLSMHWIMFLELIVLIMMKLTVTMMQDMVWMRDIIAHQIGVVGWM